MHTNQSESERSDICPSCGLTGVHPRDDFGCATFEICECCGMEFGYEDSTIESTRGHRERWLAAGAQWFEPKAKPQGWNLELQLANLPERFR